MLAFLLGVMLVPALDLIRIDPGHAAVVNNALQAQLDERSVVVISLPNAAAAPKAPAAADVPGDINSNVGPSARAGQKSAAALRPIETCDEMEPSLVAGYQSLLRQMTALEQDRVRKFAALADVTIVGTASTYNPYNDGGDAEYFETASGDLYDPADWTAAIKIDLRQYFGGVRYGRNYRPTYALVESGNKQIIVRINDVGPLRPGRVIDLNEQSMRYFDPSLERGLVHDVKVTLLPGNDWAAGPVAEPLAVTVASSD